MEVGFHKSLQLFVANGYCVFENNICVYPDVLSGEPYCANSPLPGFFVKARCPPVLAPSGIAAVEVANSPLPRFFARAGCSLVLVPFGIATREVYG